MDFRARSCLGLLDSVQKRPLARLLNIRLLKLSVRSVDSARPIGQGVGTRVPRWRRGAQKKEEQMVLGRERPFPTIVSLPLNPS